MYYSEEQMREEEDAAFGDGYPNEIARASAEARLFSPSPRNQRQEAVRLTEKGYAVICCEVSVFCRVTSAVIGEEFIIQRVCNTRAYAEHLVKDAPHDSDYCEFVFSLPTAPMIRPAQPCPFMNEEEIPF